MRKIDCKSLCLDGIIEGKLRRDKLSKQWVVYSIEDENEEYTFHTVHAPESFLSKNEGETLRIELTKNMYLCRVLDGKGWGEMGPLQRKEAENVALIRAGYVSLDERGGKRRRL